MLIVSGIDTIGGIGLHAITPTAFLSFIHNRGGHRGVIKGSVDQGVDTYTKEAPTHERGIEQASSIMADGNPIHPAAVRLRWSIRGSQHERLALNDREKPLFRFGGRMFVEAAPALPRSQIHNDQAVGLGGRISDKGYPLLPSS